jgi:RHH-type rel operon transcriptional repressor/antitoxin RelB
MESSLLYLYIVSTQELKMLAIRLPVEIENRLEALAKATGRSKTFYAREAILEHLDDLEDVYLAEQRLIDIRSGKTQTIPLEEVMKRYGLED